MYLSRGTDIDRVCSKCKLVKCVGEFYTTNQNKSGLRSQCISCHHSYQQNKERRKITSSRYYEKRKLENPALFMWKQAKHRAKFDYNDMEFSIELSDIVIPKLCPYLGVELIPLHKDYGYSLDRIDSAKGYTKDNIQVISYMANKMKNNATKEQLIAFAKGVLAVHSKEG
jgi:hypothetical protein